ncbi:MAG: TatD family hydrolase, partial [Planctomycetes bacterium]|nr:TatD family hydrolase [Planctomycetota bacterium]
MIDTHAHVDGPRFDGDRDETLARAFAAGVRTFVNVGHCVASSKRSVALASVPAAPGRPSVFATVGIHPHEAATTTDADFAEIEAMARAPRVVGIGECGLDRGPHNHADFVAQEALLRRHVDLARRTGLPLVIHNRDTYPDLFRVLEDESRAGGVRGIMHCFSGGPAEAERSVALGFYVSFSGVLTFKNAPATREAAKIVPADRLLVETDCPYLAPEPHRGQRNEPAYVALTLARLAVVRGVD